MEHEFEIIHHTEIEYVKAFVLEISTRSFHGHKDLEIGLILAGTIRMVQSGTRTLLKKGDIFLVNSNDIHSFERTNEDNLVLAIQISPKLIHRYHSTLSNTRFDVTLLNSCLSNELLSLFKGLILELTYSYYQKKDFYELHCMTFLHMLLYQLYQKCPHHTLNDKELSTKKELSRRLNRMVQYIEDHYNQPISLQDLATQENLSVTYVSHYIKNHLGLSFQTYLNTIRFEHASFLLLNTDLTILNICIETGISSSRYLNNMFMKQFHCSALDFKKKAKLPENESFTSIHPQSPSTQEKYYHNFDTLKTLIKYKNEVSPYYIDLLSTFFL